MIAVVKFYGNSTPYHFKCNIDVKQDDLVVVDTNGGFQIARVVDVTNNSKYATKWVIQKVDLEAHKKRNENEKRINELLNKMENRIQYFPQFTLFKAFSLIDPDMKKYYEEYINLIEESCEIK